MEIFLKIIVPTKTRTGVVLKNSIMKINGDLIGSLFLKEAFLLILTVAVNVLEKINISSFS